VETLVLNADAQPLSYLPLSTVTWQDAIMYMYNDKCDVIEWYEDRKVRSQRFETNIPAVIMMRHYATRKNYVRFSKSLVYLRDQYTCLYCGCGVERKDATLDHVIPRSRGGKTTWENSATSCRKCNHEKGDKLGWKPAYKPYKPGYYELVRKRKQLPFSVKHPSWYQWLDINGE
jgi:5-methylcytosine-specific restriction endonuclease McrA